MHSYNYLKSVTTFQDSVFVHVTYCLNIGSSVNYKLEVGCTPINFNPGEKAPGNYWIGGWVGPRGGNLKTVAKIRISSIPRN
jgi:hypothetical protein